MAIVSGAGGAKVGGSVRQNGNKNYWQKFGNEYNAMSPGAAGYGTPYFGTGPNRSSTATTAKADGTGGTVRSSGGGGTSTGNAQQNAYNAYLAQMADWYGAAIGNIESAYGAAAGAYAGNLASAQAQIQAAYDKSYRDVRRDAERSLREAYINHMMNKRDLNQSMSAQGLTGGASETTMASMANQYGNSRTGINENWNDNIANIAMTRDNNLAQALQMYNSQMAQLEQAKAQQVNAAEMARAQMSMQLGMANLGYLNKYGNPTIGMMDGNPYVTGLNLDDSSYITGLNNLIANQSYDWNPSDATNLHNKVSAQQSIGMTGNEYAKYLASLELMAEAEKKKKSMGGGAGTMYQMVA